MSWKTLATFCFLILGPFVASGSPLAPLSYDREAEEDQVLKNYEALLELVNGKYVVPIKIFRSFTAVILKLLCLRFQNFWSCQVFHGTFGFQSPSLILQGLVLSTKILRSDKFSEKVRKF
jgi:hypothetical protein